MASVKFLILNSTSNPAPIYIRFKPSQIIDLKVKTGLLVEKNEWSDIKQKVKPNSRNAISAQEINDKLEVLTKFINATYNKDYSGGVLIDSKWLKNTIKVCFNQSVNNEDNRKYFLVDFAEWFIDNSKNRLNNRNRQPISIRTIQDYKITLKYIKELELHKKKAKTRLRDVSTDFYHEFLDYLNDYLELSPNTIGGHISNLILFCKEAEKKGYDVCQDYKNGSFIKPKNKTVDTYLSIEEIEAIHDYRFENETLENVKDWLVIGVWTGLRVSDLLKLDVKKHIIDDFIEKENKKTSIITVIPLHEHITQILKKRNNSFPRKISDQKFNYYVKQVCKEIGINEVIEGSKKILVEIEKIGDNGVVQKTKSQRKVYGKFPKYELITSHICRRSFASNHYGKIDNLTLMNITGHKSERIFLDYVKVTPKEHAQKLKELWKKINTTQKNS